MTNIRNREKSEIKPQSTLIYQHESGQLVLIYFIYQKIWALCAHPSSSCRGLGGPSGGLQPLFSRRFKTKQTQFSIKIGPHRSKQVPLVPQGQIRSKQVKIIMVLKLSENGPKIVPKCSQNSPKMVTKWSKNSPKWSQDSPKMVPKQYLYLPFQSSFLAKNKLYPPALTFQCQLNFC